VKCPGSISHCSNWLVVSGAKETVGPDGAIIQAKKLEKNSAKTEFALIFALFYAEMTPGRSKGV
jgi:hypothetical protein